MGRGERGANTIEYCALVVLVAAALVTALSTGAPAQLAGRFTQAVCQVAQEGCGGSGPGSGGLQGVRADRAGQGGGAGGLGRVSAEIGSWFVPPPPEAVSSGRADGEDARDSFYESWDDWDGWLEDVTERIHESTPDPEYSAEFFRGLGSDAALHIFRVALHEYDEDGDGHLDDGELERAREELGLLAHMLAGSLRHGTLPEDYRDELLNGDPEALSMLIDLAPAGLPPDFLNQAVHNIFDDPSSSTEDQLRALQALGENPAAAQSFLSDRDNLDLFETHPLWDHEQLPEHVARIFDAALRYDVGSIGHQRSFANVIDYVNDNDGWFEDGDFDEARQVLATRLVPHMRYLSRLGQRLAGRDPDGAPPAPRIPVSPEEMQEFLGVVMGDPESREIFNDAVVRYAAEHDPLTEIAPDTEVRDLDEFLDRTDEVGGLFTLAVLGQNEAHISAQEERDLVLDMYDTVTGGPAKRVLLRAASRLGGPATAAAGEAIDRVAEEGRQRLEEELQEGVDAQNPAAEANRLIESMTQDLDAQLEAQGVTDPEDRETMTRLITLVYKGELYDGMVQIIDAP
ncbi:MAG: hypothetical protein GEV03_01115 [Streptosporangiales bacterium]|nr:hypothetical protein [Streptosporangiales bacterium]